MIALYVSESYALDYYAILLVKHSHRMKGVKALIKLWQSSFECQSWRVPLYEVEDSKEFKELLKSNHQTWNLVAKASKDECKASEVDAANQRRYAAKKALQEKFWPSQPLNEVKAER